MAKQLIKEHINGNIRWKLEYENNSYELYYWYVNPPGQPTWELYSIYRSNLVSRLGFWWNKHKTGNQAHNE